MTGVIKDKTTKRAISGVIVKITGLQPVTSNSKGVYRIQNVGNRRQDTQIQQNGYAAKSVTRNVTGAMKNDVLMTASGAALSSVSLSDNEVPVGTVVNGTVTLNRTAPSGGAKISLSSTSPATAAVQSSVITIPAGKKTGAFKVKAKAGGTAVIKATYNNGSKTANLKVTGGGRIRRSRWRLCRRHRRTRLRLRNSHTAPVSAWWSKNPAGGVLAKCTFDASASNATCRFNVQVDVPRRQRVQPNERDIHECAAAVRHTAQWGLLIEPVTLTVTTPSGAVSAPFPRSVNFTKTGLC